MTHPHSTDFNIWLNTTKLWLSALFDLNFFFGFRFLFPTHVLVCVCVFFLYYLLFISTKMIPRCVKFWIWPQRPGRGPNTLSYRKPQRGPVDPYPLPPLTWTTTTGWVFGFARCTVVAAAKPRVVWETFQLFCYFFFLSHKEQGTNVYKVWRYGRDRIARWARQSPLLFVFI